MRARLSSRPARSAETISHTRGAPASSAASTARGPSTRNRPSARRSPGPRPRRRACRASGCRAEVSGAERLVIGGSIPRPAGGLRGYAGGVSGDHGAKLAGILDVGAAAAALADGGVVLVPTETFYALSADPRREDAVRKVMALKGRSAGKALPLAAGSVEQVGHLCPGWRRYPVARRLADAFWPGPLSLVLPARPGAVAPGVAAADGSVAIRVSSHGPAAALARALGYAIVATSANRSGAPPARTPEEARASLGGAEPIPVLAGTACRGGAPSTIVDPRSPEPRVLREGAVPAARIEAILRSAGNEA
ncbi:MAG: threonylcarbamoyl-AMP synthase [Acidobacteria bacterium]|nr:MAG: threonylcarbamoyl-AMP synthase [Acidobacteriota bacterium]